MAVSKVGEAGKPVEVSISDSASVKRDLHAALDEARRVAELLAKVDQLEIVHPALIDGDCVVRARHLGVSKSYLCALWARLAPLLASCRWALAPADRALLSCLALVATTDNVTAVNIRKELVACRLIEPADELHILDVLQSSHLPKHTKSSTLWAHRQWLHDTGLVQLDEAREREIICRAAICHPRNYYAWNYARCLARRRDANAQDWSNWAFGLCKQNLSDISMWSFLAAVDSARTHRTEVLQLYNRYPHETILFYLKLTF